MNNSMSIILSKYFNNNISFGDNGLVSKKFKSLFTFCFLLELTNAVFIPDDKKVNTNTSTK
jgi:hypothetical protein